MRINWQAIGSAARTAVSPPVESTRMRQVLSHAKRTRDDHPYLSYPLLPLHSLALSIMSLGNVFIYPIHTFGEAAAHSLKQRALPWQPKGKEVLRLEQAAWGKVLWSPLYSLQSALQVITFALLALIVFIPYARSTALDALYSHPPRTTYLEEDTELSTMIAMTTNVTIQEDETRSAAPPQGKHENPETPHDQGFKWTSDDLKEQKMNDRLKRRAAAHEKTQQSAPYL